MTTSMRIPLLRSLPQAGILVLLAASWICWTLPARAADLHVSPDGSGQYPNIQFAIDDAVSGDTVVLAAGTYTGLGNHNMNIEASITIRSANPGDLVVIDLEGSAANPSFGFHITDGNPTLERLTIRNAYGPHGAVDLYSGALQVTRCNFYDNSSDLGGALRCVGGDRIAMTHCILAGNSADDYGGAIYASDDGEIDLTNCTLFMNEAAYGSGIYLRNGATLAMDQCIVAYGRGVGAIGDYYAGGFAITDTDIWANEGGDWIWSLAPLLGVDGNVRVDPEMCDPAGKRFALTAGSPCANPPSVVMGAAGQDPTWDVPVYGLRPDGSGMYPTIQAALDGVPGQAAVRLFAGGYSGPGNAELDFRGKEIDLASIPGHAAVIDATSWDGQPKRAVWLQSGEPVGTTIHDLTISNGEADFSGGGIYLTGGSSVALRDVHFQGNSALTGSAVTAATTGEVVIDACTFADNGPGNVIRGTAGTMWIGNLTLGADSVQSIHLSDGLAGATLSNVTIDGCLGLYALNVYGPILFENCTLVRAGGNGRTEFVSCADVRFENCTLRSDGSVDTDIVNANDSMLAFTDCSFAGLGSLETNVVAVTALNTDVSFRRTTFADLRSDGVRGTVNLQVYSNATLDSCTFEQTATGVGFAGMSYRNLIVRDCRFVAVGAAVTASGINPSQVTIADTEFTACGQGVQLTDITDATLSGCGFRGSGPGVPVLATNSTLVVTDCEFHDANVTTMAGREDSGGIAGRGGQVTVTGCEFLRNDCQLGPGGVSMREGTVEITDCLFSGNNNVIGGSSLTPGGAVVADAVDLFRMTGSRLEGNTASEAGAASLSGLSLVLDSCEIVDNAGTYDLGGLSLQPYFNLGTLTMTGCLVAGNTAPTGPGVEIYGSAGALLESCTFVGNGSPGGGGQIEFSGTGAMDIQSSIIAYGHSGAALDVYAPEYLTLTVTCTDIHGNPGGDWTGALAPFRRGRWQHRRQTLVLRRGRRGLPPGR